MYSSPWVILLRVCLTALLDFAFLQTFSRNGVGEDVLFKISLSRKRFLAKVAWMLLITSMNKEMWYKDMFIRKSLVAHVTRVRFFARVYAEVFPEIWLVGVRFVAHLAQVRFLIRVQEEVRLEVTFLWKRLLADFTGMGLFPRVDEQVLYEAGVVLERLSADCAQAGFHAGLDVHSGSGCSMEVDCQVQGVRDFGLAFSRKCLISQVGGYFEDQETFLLCFHVVVSLAPKEKSRFFTVCKNIFDVDCS